ncbi:MAG: hypothetical protein KJO43_07545, partial [Phycisphaerae bacterium]|nr:hypothetical protein [Phycisphaerae bacterium]
MTARLRGLISTTIVTLVTLAGSCPSSGAEPFRLGVYEATASALRQPAAVAIGVDDAIYVAEADAGRIAIYGRDGILRRVLGRRGHGEGELLDPGGVAVTPDGRVFVSDTGNHRVQVFGPDGTRRTGWGSYGAAAGAFNEPRGIDVTSDRVYVCDLGNHRVQIFDHDGAPVGVIGGFGVEPGRFNRPLDVVVATDRSIFVADADNNRIQKFSADGDYLLAWGDWGPFSGLLDEPSGLAWHDGRLFVADRRNHRIQLFDAGGTLIERWGTHAVLPHEGEGKLHYPDDLAIAPSGTFAVVAEAFERRVQIFASDPGPAPEAAEATRTVLSRKVPHFGTRLDIDEKLLTIAEPESHRVYVFELSGKIPIIIGDFGERGTRFGQMIRAAGLELDVAQRALLMTDTATRRVQRFHLDYDPDAPRAYSRRRGRFSRSDDFAAIAERDGIDVAWPIEPAALEQDADGNWYVVDARNCRVFVFDPDWRFERSWGGYGGAPGQLRQPTDLAFDQSGEVVYVVDAGNHRVQMFDRSGRTRGAFGQAGDGPGQFAAPFGLSAGRDGFVYVTDRAAHRVQKFTESGDFVTAWGELGIEHEQFWQPRGIDQDDAGRVYVLDYGNHKAKI